MDAPGTYLSRGNIALDGHLFITDGYQPPTYPRALSYDDTAVSQADGTVRVSRAVTDQGPTLGIWKQFAFQCCNDNVYDQLPVAERGRAQYLTLIALSQALRPLRLHDFQSGDEYWVTFDQTGLVTEYFVKPNTRDGEGNDLGPEYLVHVTLLETEAPDAD